MKHIVVITTSYPMTGDGSEAAGSFVQDFASELARHARVTVLAPGKAVDSIPDENLNVIRYRSAGRPLSLLKVYNPLHWPAIIGILRDGARKLENICATNPVDHIFALWVLPCGEWARSASHRFAVPYSTWALGSDIWTLGKIPLIRKRLRQVLRQSTTNYADGRQLCRDVEKLCGRPCHFLPSTRAFIPQPNHEKDRDGYNLVFLGRWHVNKGADLLLEALRLLEENDWSKIGEIRIFGGGPMAEFVTDAVKKLQQAGRPVILGGYVNKYEASELFAWSDMILIPSRIESIPVVFSDAMKAGKPVMAMPVGDLVYLVENYHCGLVAKEVSARAYADILHEGLNQEKGTFSNGIKEAANDFSLTLIVKNFLAGL